MRCLTSLVVEFYSDSDAKRPIASVLACHGGDSPSTAATTLSDFFDLVASLREPRFGDPYLLAARFVVFESSKTCGAGSLDFTDVALIPYERNYGLQTVCVFAGEPRPRIHFVMDQWSSERELKEASSIIG